MYTAPHPGTTAPAYAAQRQLLRSRPPQPQLQIRSTSYQAAQLRDHWLLETALYDRTIQRHTVRSITMFSLDCCWKGAKKGAMGPGRALCKYNSETVLYT